MESHLFSSSTFSGGYLFGQVFYLLSVQYLVGIRLPMSMESVLEIGTVSHFFSKISVGIVDLAASLSVGDRILIKGPSTDFEMTVESMQIEHKNVQRAEAGQSIGLKLAQQAKERDVVYRKL